MDEYDFGDDDDAYFVSSRVSAPSAASAKATLQVEYDPTTHCSACKRAYRVLQHANCDMVYYAPCESCCVVCSPYAGPDGTCEADYCTYKFNNARFKRVVPKTEHSGEVSKDNPLCCIYVPPPPPTVATTTTAASAALAAAEMTVAAAAAVADSSTSEKPKTANELAMEYLARMEEISAQRMQEELARRAAMTAGADSEQTASVARLQRRPVAIQCIRAGNTLVCEEDPETAHNRRLIDARLEALTKQHGGKWWHTFKMAGGAGLTPPVHLPLQTVSDVRCVCDNIFFNDVKIYEKLQQHKLSMASPNPRQGPMHSNALMFTLSKDHMRALLGLKGENENHVIIRRISVCGSNNTTPLDWVPVPSTYYTTFDEKVEYRQRFLYTKNSCEYTKYGFEETNGPEPVNYIMRAGESRDKEDVVLFEQNLHNQCCVPSLKRWSTVKMHEEWAKHVVDIKQLPADRKSTEKLAKIRISPLQKSHIAAPSVIVYFIGKELPNGVLERILPTESWKTYTPKDPPESKVRLDPDVAAKRAEHFRRWKRLEANIVEEKDGVAWLIVKRDATRSQLQMLWNKVSTHTRVSDLSYGLQINMFLARNISLAQFTKSLEDYVKRMGMDKPSVTSKAPPTREGGFAVDMNDEDAVEGVSDRRATKSTAARRTRKDKDKDEEVKVPHKPGADMRSPEMDRCFVPSQLGLRLCIEYEVLCHTPEPWDQQTAAFSTAQVADDDDTSEESDAMGTETSA